jgi:hypothetical protein
MGLFLPGKKVRNRRFDYEPRFYDPSKDERLRRRIRVQSRVHRKRSPLGLIIFGILLLMVLLIYMNLG